MLGKGAVMERPGKSDMIEIGRRAEQVYERADQMIRRGASLSMDVVDASVGRDLWRKVAGLAGAPEPGDFPEPERLADIGRAASLALDSADLKRAAGCVLELYVAIGERVWDTAVGAPEVRPSGPGR